MGLLRNKHINFRVTEEEYQILWSKLEKSGLKLNQYMWELTQNGEVRARLTPVEVRLFQELTGLANDLHLLAEKARSEGLELLALSCAETLVAINELFKAFDAC